MISPKKNHKKRVLQISARGDCGGGPFIMHSIVEGLASEDSFRFNVFCPNQEPFYSEFQKLPQIKLHEFDGKNFSPKNFCRFFRLTLQIAPDVIHCHGKGAGFWGRLAKIFCPKAKILYQLHGIHFENYGFLMKRFYFWYEKFFSLFTRCALHVSESERKVNLAFSLTPFSEKVVIRNGIDFSNLPKPFHDKKRKKKFKIVTIARLAKKKNFELTFEILRALRKKKFDFEFFLFCSEDELTFDDVRRLARQKAVEDNLTILDGRGMNVFENLNGKDCFLSTSKIEGLPTTFIEACMSGIPIVATDVVGNDEFGDLETVKLIHPANIQGFCDALIDFSKNRIDPLVPRSYAEKNFSREQMLEKHKSLYLNL